uniref:Uncharacterized protein n=1 Tax=Chenopodium quinoa TaxID=63459 RepID=A0A803MMI0_CHEQI
MQRAAQTGKSSVHDFLDVNGRPQLIVQASKHYTGIEKDLSKIPEGQEQIFGIIDLRGFGTDIFDIRPSAHGGSAFCFKPLWQLAKPLLKKHALLVALVNGIAIGGLEVHHCQEKSVFATPEVAIGFHTNCGF